MSHPPRYHAHGDTAAPRRWGHGGKPLLLPQSPTLPGATTSPASHPAWAGRGEKRVPTVVLGTEEPPVLAARWESVPGLGELPLRQSASMQPYLEMNPAPCHCSVHLSLLPVSPECRLPLPLTCRSVPDSCRCLPSRRGGQEVTHWDGPGDAFSPTSEVGLPSSCLARNHRQLCSTLPDKFRCLRFRFPYVFKCHQGVFHLSTHQPRPLGTTWATKQL